MRFFTLARRVIQTEREKKAMPPTKSFRFVLSRGLDWVNCVEGSEGGGVCGGFVWFVEGSGFGVSGLELEPQPKKENML